jgi:branched-chain amino acid transport system ATP-binding protein
MALVEVDSLDQFYGDFQALFGISLLVDEGEVLAIIGANGAGKSTFLKTIVGIVPSRAEAVRFDGAPIGRLPAHRRAGMGIALVPEGRHVFPSLSVRENLDVGAYGGRTGPWTLPRVLDLFPLLDRVSARSAAVLSGGEQQALAIGRALMANPRLLLVDEMSLGLAPVVIDQLYGAIPVIKAEGTTLILVEQDITRALAIADRACCFLEGRVSLEGRPEELDRPLIRAAYFGV